MNELIVRCRLSGAILRLFIFWPATLVLPLTGCAGQQVSIANAHPVRQLNTSDPSRGRAVVTGRDGNCLLCHAIPETGARFMGNLGPSLSGIGARLNAAQLKSRITDPQRLNPDSIMPAYARTEGLTQVGRAYIGKPILTAQQIDDVVAYLATLR